MNPIDDYFLIKRDDLHWRCSNIVKTPNTDFLKTKSFLVHVYGKMRRGIIVTNMWRRALIVPMLAEANRRDFTIKGEVNDTTNRLT